MVNKFTNPPSQSELIEKTNEIIDALGTGGVSIDNTTITQNDNSELQAQGVINQNAGEAVKTWTGTKAEYDAIETKDPSTVYNITDDLAAAAYEAYTKEQVDTLIKDALYYKSGETYSFTAADAGTGFAINVIGTLTSSKLTIMFSVQLPKSLNNISTITLNSLKTNIRGEGVYIPTNVYTNGGVDVFSFSSVIVRKIKDNIFDVQLTLNTAASVSNNIPLVVEINQMSLTFT